MLRQLFVSMGIKNCTKENKDYCWHNNFYGYLPLVITYIVITLALSGYLSLFFIYPEMLTHPVVAVFGIGYTILLYKCIYSAVAMLKPEKGKLGKSLLRYTITTNYAKITQLMNTINEDMSSNGMKFERFWIGKEWVLGREALRIEHIRGIFHSCPISLRGRQYNFILVDDRDNTQTVVFFKKEESETAFHYLSGLIPLAETGNYGDYLRFINRSDEERTEINKRFEKVQNDSTRKPGKMNEEARLIFSGLEGGPTSNFKLWDVFSALAALNLTRQCIWLTPCIPIPTTEQQEIIDLSIKLSDSETTTYTLSVFYRGKERYIHVLCADFALEEVMQLITSYVKEQKVPDTTDWEDCTELLRQEKTGEDYVLYIDKIRYEHITFEDISVAFSEFNEGKHNCLVIRTPSWENGYMSVEGQTDDYIVEVAGFNSEGEVCGYRTHTIYGGHVIHWLANYYSQRTYPTINDDWEDISIEIRKRNKEQE